MDSRSHVINTLVSADTAKKHQTASSWADLLKKEGLDSDFNLNYVAPININNKRIVTVKEYIDKRTENK